MTGKLVDLSMGMNRKQRITVEVNEDFEEKFLKLKDADLDIEIKKHRERRSLDANAYAWVLIDKLAKATNTPKNAVYWTAIREIGGNTETVCVKQEAADKLCAAWTKNGLGWLAEKMPSKLPGCVNVVLYYGSSTFDTAQMARFIDGIIQDCKAVGVETLPPDKLEAMLEGWK